MEISRNFEISRKMPHFLEDLLRIFSNLQEKKMFRLVGRTVDCLRTAVNYYMYAILGLMMSIPGPTLIDLEHSSKTDAYGISFIYIARSTGYLIGSLTGGIVLDCIKKDEMALFLSSITIATGAFVIPFCRSLPILLVNFIILGFAIGFSNTGCNASCLRIWGKKSAPVLQGLHLLYGLGAMMAPLIAAPFLQDNLKSSKELKPTITEFQELSTIPPIINHTDVEPVDAIIQGFPTITYAYIIIGVLAVLVSLCFLLLCVYTPQKTDKKEDLKTSQGEQSSFFTVIVVILACLLTGLSSGIEVSFTQMLTSYVVGKSHGLSKSKGSYITSAYWSSFTAARFLSIFLTCKLDIRKILVCVLVLSVSSSLVLLTIGTWSVTALWIGAAMLGVSMAPIFPGTLSWVERYIDFNNRIASIFTLVSCLLEMIVPFTISIYLNTFPEILFTFLTGATILATAIFILLNIILNSKGEKYEDNLNQTEEKKEIYV